MGESARNTITSATLRPSGFYGGMVRWKIQAFDSLLGVCQGLRESESKTKGILWAELIPFMW